LKFRKRIAFSCEKLSTYRWRLLRWWFLEESRKHWWWWWRRWSNSWRAFSFFEVCFFCWRNLYLYSSFDFLFRWTSGSVWITSM